MDKEIQLSLITSHVKNDHLYLIWNRCPSDNEVLEANIGLKLNSMNIIHCYKIKDIIIQLSHINTECIAYEEYLKAKKTVISFKKSIINEFDIISHKNKSKIKDLVFKLLSDDKTIKTIEIANKLKISRQLAHKYRQDFNNLK